MWAVFVLGTYNLTDQLTLTVGARYTDEEKDFTKIDGLFLLSDPQPVKGTPAGFQIANFSFPEETGNYAKLTPKLGLDYRASEKVMFYGSVTRGFKSGGFNFIAVFPGGYDEETLWAYEVGLKSDLADNRMRLNLAAFYYDYEGLQVQTFVVPATVDTTNAATAEVQGLEVEVIITPIPEFEISASLAYLDASYDDYPEAPITGGGTFNASRNRLNSSPEWSTSIVAQYEFNIGSGSAFVVVSSTGRTKCSLRSTTTRSTPRVVTAYLGLKAYGVVYGTMYSAFQIGTGIGPLAMGLSFDRLDSYTVGLWILCAAMAIAVVVISRLGFWPRILQSPPSGEKGLRSGRAIPS